MRHVAQKLSFVHKVVFGGVVSCTRLFPAAVHDAAVHNLGFLVNKDGTSLRDESGFVPLLVGQKLGVLLLVSRACAHAVHPINACRSGSAAALARRRRAAGLQQLVELPSQLLYLLFCFFYLRPKSADALSSQPKAFFVDLVLVSRERKFSFPIAVGHDCAERILVPLRL